MNAKQQVFVEEYLTCWNATEAARRAGYSEKSIRSIAAENLTKPDIKAEIEARLAEIKMSADEVLLRLANMARANIADFAEVAKITDLKKEEYIGKSHVVKKFKRKVTRDALNREHEEIEIELYDAQAALVHIGKVHGLFAEKIEHSGELVFKVVYDDNGDGSQNTPA